MKLPDDVMRIDDAASRMRLRQLLNGVVGYPADIATEYLRTRGWAACPVADQPEVEDWTRICAAASRLAVQSCNIVPTEMGGFSAAYRANLTPSALDRIATWNELSLTNLVFIPDSSAFVIVKESADYFLVAGPPTFVKEAVGAALQDALRAFEQAAARTAGNTRYVQLGPIADRYRPFTMVSGD